MGQQHYHRPVLAERAVGFLITIPHGIYVDCTVGGAGHSQRIAESIYPAGKLVCIDADADAIAYAQAQLRSYSHVIIKQAYFDQIDVILDSENYCQCRVSFLTWGFLPFRLIHQ